MGILIRLKTWFSLKQIFNILVAFKKNIPHKPLATIEHHGLTEVNGQLKGERGTAVKLLDSRDYS